MVELGDSLFGGGKGPGPAVADAARAEVSNYADSVDAALSKFGWKGEVAACVVLGLTGDNRAVSEGQLVIRGRQEDRESKLDISRVWPEADAGTILSIDVDLSKFQFSKGGLFSDYVESDSVVHHYAANAATRPRVLLASETARYGIGQFSLRMVCQLSRDCDVERGVWLEFVVLLFPESAADRAKRSAALTDCPSWPGLFVVGGEIPLLPWPTVPWRCPVVPLLLAGTPFAQEPLYPTAGNLREAIAGIMRRAGAPDVCKTASGLVSKWSRIERRREGLQPAAVAVTWPAAGTETSEASDGGRNLFIASNRVSQHDWKCKFMWD